MKKQNASIIKIANMQLILDTIVAYGSMSNEAIVFQTRLSRPTVIKTLDILIENAIIEKNGFLNTGGRNAQLYELNNKKYYAISIDFEFPVVRIAITNLKQEIQYYKSWMYGRNELQDRIIERLLKEIRLGISSVRKDDEVFIGIAIGLPGLIDIERGVSVYIERIEGWKDIEIKQILLNEFQIPVYIENDVHLLAFVGKSMNNGEPKTGNSAYISLRYGIGMALFLNNKFYGGSKGNAGFWGHMVIDPQGDMCRCKKKGCIEAYSSSWAIVDYYLRKTNQEATDDFTLENVVDAFLKGDRTAIAAIKRASHYLGLGISNIIMLLDISTVIINGLPSRCKARMLDWINQSIQENIVNHIIETKIIGEELDEKEKVLGGARWIIKSFLTLSKDVLEMEEQEGSC